MLNRRNPLEHLEIHDLESRWTSICSKPAFRPRIWHLLADEES